MTNAEMAERLEQIASDLDGMDSGNADSPILRAGAEALLVMDQRKREECAHCDERPGGHEGTIWCAECLNWWRQQHSTQEADAAQREVERLRGAIHDIYSIASRAQAEPELSTGDLVDICTICEDHGGDTTDPRDARIAELEADKARWDALEALPYQIEVTMRMERVKHPAMISLREQVDAALKRIAALKEAK